MEQMTNGAAKTISYAEYQAALEVLMKKAKGAMDSNAADHIWRAANPNVTVEEPIEHKEIPTWHAFKQLSSATVSDEELAERIESGIIPDTALALLGLAPEEIRSEFDNKDSSLRKAAVYAYNYALANAERKAYAIAMGHDTKGDVSKIRLFIEGFRKHSEEAILGKPKALTAQVVVSFLEDVRIILDSHIADADTVSKIGLSLTAALNKHLTMQGEYHNASYSNS